ncbi:uncharacterized protein Triagg1_8370 [Trichoderma aggressivum f. europaeum]|uniref:Xaa-Pro dipeptidyl-peptidase-like domain-containing protein n=1 Tax=Trichoderma aggressivum f. europaeum TaxID=173218 RepID=A0AAE1LY08_9HYPO|nr:hypothetical protein Triagg1_8370 [Trichoderma aggressivum f. europaeum]
MHFTTPPKSEPVEFTTLDGLTLRGQLYAASSRGPAVIMTPGWNCVKEMLLPEVAERFQAAGFTALTYDPRNLGESDGMPRNEIDPAKQVEDYSDALTYLSRHPMVDPSKIAFWGMSFSGSIAACAAALDKRAKVLISICPMTVFFTDEKRQKILSKAIMDRVSQLKGNRPFMLVPFTKTGENPGGLAQGGGREAYEFMSTVKDHGAPNYENHTTIQSYYRMMMWQPWPLFEHVDPTPAMVLIPDGDQIAKPEDQRRMFDALSGPKKLVFARGKGHLNVLSGEDAEMLIQEQVEFMRDAFEGKPIS